MKKRKLKKKFIIILLILLIIIIGIIIYKILNNNINSSKKFYSDKVIEVIKENKYNDIYKKEYSKTIELLIENNLYRNEYLEEYLKINYVDNIIIENINKYLDIGYNGDEINNIYKLSNKNQNKLLNLTKQDFNKYINIKNFNVDNIDRYNNYLNKTNKNIEDVVTYVNINLDKEFYTDSTEIENPNDLTVIVNKFHHLNKDFTPNDLVTLFDSKNGAKMVNVAALAYKDLINAAKNDGIILESTTAYRSYTFQNTLYTNYVKKDGIDLADTYSARPGSSEHQLGLAVDLNDPNYNNARLSNTDYEWLKNNSYKYGFILRYTKEGETITGYIEENWHIRYLGITLATKVYESGLTYEEYYDLYIMEY